MDAASKNAGNMIGDLSLEIQPCAARRHHAEITEIVAGAEA